MTDREEWGTWIDHDGKVCPVMVGQYIQTKSIWKDRYSIKEGLIRVFYQDGGDWNWRNYPKNWKVIRYRIRKPRGLTMLERVARDVTAPIEQVDA